jgi:hypothetical protein
MARGGINYSQPINRSHAFARGLGGMWLPLPWYSSGPRLIDIAGRNHGVLTGAPTWAAGPTGFGAIKFDGVLDSVETSYAGIDKGCTLAAWVNPSALSEIQTIFGSLAANQWLQFRINTNGALSFVKASTIDIGTGTAGVVTTNTWTFVTGTYDTSGNYAFYANGVPCGTGTNSQTINPATLGFGRNTGNGEDFTGRMTSMMMWPSRILSASEVAVLSNEARTGFPTLLNRLSSRQMKGAAATGNRRRRFLCGAA